MSSEREQQNALPSAREEKRAQFTEGAKRGGGNARLAVLILALAGAASYFIYTGLKPTGASPTRAAETQSAAGEGEVRVALKELEGGKAVFIEPKLSSGKPVRFFVVKAADNTYRAALDACEVCHHARKGYEQKGSDMICRNCGRDFAIADIGPHNEGGCHPIALRQTIEGDQLVIKTSELESGTSYF